MIKARKGRNGPDSPNDLDLPYVGLSSETNCWTHEAVSPSGDMGRKQSPFIVALDEQRSLVMTKSFRNAALVAAFAVSFSALSTSSHAFSPEAQQMCTGDALRLCSSEIPDIPRITACMIRNHVNLSSGCRTVMDREAQQSPAVASKNATTARKPPLG